MSFMGTTMNFDTALAELTEAARSENLETLDRILATVQTDDLARVLERFDANTRAVMFRLLPKETALRVFEQFTRGMRSELISSLRDDHVVAVFEMLDPDDRASLVDELPAILAARLMQGLSPEERLLTAPMLGYPRSSVGRRMNPEFIRLRPESSVVDALAHVRSVGKTAETVYLMPVADAGRILVGVISLRDLLLAPAESTVGQIMKIPLFARAESNAEASARRCVDLRLLAMPVVDREERIIGILTVDDAARILAEAEEEDSARAGATEPLLRPYLSTSILSIVRSRIVWLLVLAVSAVLTVQVLEVFEGALASAVVLALFIPLLTGTGGNTGSQAATTVTRALAMGDVRLRDVGTVALREVRVGLMMGLLLGLLGFVVAGLVYGQDIGFIIGITLVCVCTLAATVGGTMPLLAKAIGVDPAVFSTPFISTFCDASGLVIYFLIAKTVLGI